MTRSKNLVGLGAIPETEFKKAAVECECAVLGGYL